MAKNSGDFLGGFDGNNFVNKVTEPSPSAPKSISRVFSTDADLIFADDVEIQRYSAEYDVTWGNTTFGISYSRTLYDVDFSGPGLFDTNLTDQTDNYSLSLAHDWNDTYSSSISLSGYQGFTSFRSLWFPEFFRQNDGAFPGFRELGDPFGISVALGNTYTFANGIDSVNVGLSYSRDRIVPAQQGDFDPFTGFEIITGDDTLDTVAVSVTGNFYLTNKITTEWSARVSFVSDRDARTQLRVRAAWSILDNLTLRGEYGVTIEQPDFDAFFGGLTLDYQISNNFALSVGYRLYTDSGEVTTANFNTSAPGFDSSEVSASLLWTSGGHSVRASVAYLDTEFDPVLFANANFEQLFSDREFIAARLAYTYAF